MKYRRLTKEEFEALHEDFIYFLSANTITGEDWKTIVAETPEKAESLMDMFSDIAWQKALEKAQYVERITHREWMCARFDDQKAHMILLRAVGTENIPEKWTAAEMKKALENKAFELIRGSKSYSLLREGEMFSLIQQGASLSDGERYQSMASLLS